MEFSAKLKGFVAKLKIWAKKFTPVGSQTLKKQACTKDRILSHYVFAKKSIRREHFTQSLKREGQFAKFRTKGQLAKLLCWTYVWLATVRLHKLGPAIIKIAFTKKQFVKAHVPELKMQRGAKGNFLTLS